jgi:hypothetical protein
MMKKNLLVAVVVVAALAVLTTGVVLAQEPTPPTPGGYGMGPGMMGRYGYSAGEYGPMHEYMEEAMAKALGISVDEFEAQRAAGKTAYEIALGLGFSADKIPALLSDAHTKALEAAAADGVIPQQMLERMQYRQSAGGFGMGNCDGTGQRLGGGMMGRWGYQQSDPQ